MDIRPEAPDDFARIDDVVRSAFTLDGRDGSEEVDIVHKIRALPHCYVPEMSLVALVEGDIVGHVMFSYSRIGTRRVLQLSPLAVSPEHQRNGIGDALARRGLELADAGGEPLVLVLGHPEYYPRFGFEPALALGIRYEIPELDEPWMAMKLRAYDPSITGTAVFTPDV